MFGPGFPKETRLTPVLVYGFGFVTATDIGEYAPIMPSVEALLVPYGYRGRFPDKITPGPPGSSVKES